METLQKNLKTAIFRVMEMMYFLLPDEDVPAGRTVFIGITGTPTYLISLTFNENLTMRMAKDLLSLDEEEFDSTLLHQCLTETANIIAGNFLHTFEDSSNRNLTLPSLTKRDIFPDMAIGDSTGFTVTFEGEPVNVIIEEMHTP